MAKIMTLHVITKVLKLVAEGHNFSYHAEIGFICTKMYRSMGLDNQDNDFTWHNKSIEIGCSGPKSLVTMLKMVLFALKCIDMGLNDQGSDFTCH